MGSYHSLEKVNDCDIDFYHNIVQNKIKGKVLRVIDVNKYIIAIKHNFTLKKIICKAKGFKLKNQNDKLTAIAKFNGLANSENLIVYLKTYGLNKDGYLLIDISNNKFDNFKTIMLRENYIEEDDDELLN